MKRYVGTNGLFKVVRAGGALAFICLTAICCYTPVEAPSTGLDPSWALAITRAAEAHFVFGREIVFTYGPLGFLLAGAKTVQSAESIALARIFISITVAALTYFYSSGLSRYKRVSALAAVAIVFPFMRGREAICAGAIVALGLLWIARSSKRRGYLCVAFGG